MGDYLVAFVEYRPLDVERAERLWGPGVHACFAEVQLGEHAPNLLGELAPDSSLAVPRSSLSPEARKRRDQQAPELIASDIISLDADALARLASGSWVKTRKGCPRTLSAVLEAVRALGPGARLAYWFETD